MNVAVGQKAHRTLSLTENHVNAYAELTGDYNPLHFDEDFASKTRFKNLVVQGGLTTGLVHFYSVFPEVTVVVRVSC